MKACDGLSLFLLFLHLLPLLQASAIPNADEQEKSLQRLLQATLPPSSSSSSFNLSSPLCSWTRMIRCSSDGAVTGLFLERLGLRGIMPNNTFSSLSSLTQLSLYGNSLQSPIPSELWDLEHLQYLSLSSNLFEEEIGPEKLRKLGKMQRLDLSQNRFFGSVPEEITMLQDLRYLFLSSNNLSGVLPSSFGKKLHSLTVLDLSNNSFSGPLSPLSSSSSSSLSSSSQLQKILLSNNGFSGPIPHLMAAKILKIDSNFLSGDLSEIFISTRSAGVTTLPDLTELDLSSNRLSGNLSELLTRVSMPRLAILDLSTNRIAGSILENIGNAPNLTFLDLSDNLLNGTLPLSLAELSYLTYLDLSSNDIVGDVSPPLSASQIGSLQYLNLSYNKGIACTPALVKLFGSGSFEGVMDCEPSAVNLLLAGSRSKHNKGKQRLGLLIGAIVAATIVGLTLMFLLLAFFLCYCRKRGKSALSTLRISATHKEDSKLYASGPFSFQSNSGPWVANVRNASAVPVIMFEKPLLSLTFADLLRATSNFHKETQVSQGGLGPVYRALLPGGLHVSIKVLIEGRILTNQAAVAEFELLSKIKHPNIVSLLGYCIVGEERLVLYEFMKNGGLHRWLLGSPERLQDEYPNNSAFYEVSQDLAARVSLEPLPEVVNLAWPIRHKVALGVARALSFLHHGQSTKIVHRDVKASNVMLDDEFEPHLANTGLAGLLAGSNETVFAGGSPGYVPPEYGQPGGQVSTMGDVFSYGVILLELVTGKKPVGDTYEVEVDNDASSSASRGGFGHCSSDLVSWVRALMHVKKDGLYHVLDHRACEDQISREHMLEVLRIGYLCTAEVPSKRPTIQQVVGLLKDMTPNLISP